jgi:hypothetical protein
MTVDNLADHTLLLALPAFAPAVVVVGVVVYVAMRDRRRPDDDEAPADLGDEPHSERPGAADQDGTP